MERLHTIFTGDEGGNRAPALTIDIREELKDNVYTNKQIAKYKPKAVAELFWAHVKANAGLASAPYQDIRDNYVNCLRWVDGENWYSSNGAGIHKGLYGGLAGGDGSEEYTCRDGTVYFSEETCSLVPLSTASSPGCSTVGSLSIGWLRRTPISLIFETKNNPLATSTIVSFPLEPGKVGVRWEWRGSRDAPLLVYDPEHKGRITSAHQLFGPWTFGGKRVASLEQGSAQSWSSGFEALAELDHNHDGQVSGQELQPLGLWFDENRDAISQPGEVKSITEAGIVALRVAFERTDPKTGDLISSVGYDRLVDGKIVSGPTVDWIAHGASSSKELMMGAILDTGVESIDTDQLLAEVKQSEVSDPVPDTDGRKAHELVAGAWTVRMADAKPQDGLSGFLLFNGGETVQLNGLSLLELGVRVAHNSLRAMRFTAIEGQVSLDNNSAGTLSFTSNSGESTLENTATIDPNGNTMKGKTVATRADGSKLHYDWIARRVFTSDGERKSK